MKSDGQRNNRAALTNHEDEDKIKNGFRFQWWHGILFYAGVQLIDWGIRTAVRRVNACSRNQADREFYKRQRLPVFAPPGISFPIAWSINSATAIAGTLQVLNSKCHNRERHRFLCLQSAAWALFATFNTAYFELRSPINAAAVTLGYTLLTIASIRSASRMQSHRVVLLFLPTTAWLVLANPVAFAVAAWNRDSFWRLGPVAEPPQWLVK